MVTFFKKTCTKCRILLMVPIHVPAVHQATGHPCKAGMAMKQTV